MGKKRIIVNCPTTQVAVITNLDYDQVAKPRVTPLLFSCPCGETHQLRFGGPHHGHPQPPHQAPPGPRQGVR